MRREENFEGMRAPFRGVLLAAITVGLFIMTATGTAAGGTELDVRVSPPVICQGEPGLVRIQAGPGETPRGLWNDREVLLIKGRQEGSWFGFIGADLLARPGGYRLVVTSMPSGRKATLKVEVAEKDYGVRRLTLPKKMVDLDAETLERVRKENEITKRLWAASATTPVWQGAFLRPVPGDVVGPFGRRSIINKQPRSPHSGVDLRGEKGTPVKAINGGRVVLTGDMFFCGRSLVIDHGGGIQSMYFHLDRIDVRMDQEVSRGQVIGLVGATGRATGPHLHWGVRIQGARVNPLSLTDLSRELEE